MKLKMGLIASLLLVVGGAFWAGCGGNACDKAVSHEEDCAMTSTTSGATTGSTQGDCSGAVECEANCVNAASCDALTGKDTKGAAALLKCVTNCAK
ncbi:MAG TPA: hypothetical protein VHB21_13190 [Minicystis sp.]|nr:hypothetical protein [Minicystis sp.]